VLKHPVLFTGITLTVPFSFVFLTSQNSSQFQDCGGFTRVGFPIKEKRGREDITGYILFKTFNNRFLMQDIFKHSGSHPAFKILNSIRQVPENQSSDKTLPQQLRGIKKRLNLKDKYNEHDEQYSFDNAEEKTQSTIELFEVQFFQKSLYNALENLDNQVYHDEYCDESDYPASSYQP
jgi:hypothetical protein